SYRTPLCKTKTGRLKETYPNDILAPVIKICNRENKYQSVKVGDIVVGSVLELGSQIESYLFWAAHIAFLEPDCKNFASEMLQGNLNHQPVIVHNTHLNPGVRPVVYHGILDNSRLVHIMEQNKHQGSKLIVLVSGATRSYVLYPHHKYQHLVTLVPGMISITSMFHYGVTSECIFSFDDNHLIVVNS
nr:3-ketoacyl-CoA thiolase 2, peroxisomal [Tanacetum cinerariifolium]